MIRPDAKRNLGIGAILLMVLVLVVVQTIVTTPRVPKGPAMVGFGPNGGKIQKLTDNPASCNVTEGVTVSCTISISPAAPSNASLTFSLSPRIVGAGAWTVRDSARTPVGGTGADITTTNGGTTYCLFVTAGATSVTFPIAVVNDNIPEPTESIVATISGATNLTIGTASTTINIIDNDGPSGGPAAIYDVTAYGATVNNSSNDDTVAIRAAINAAGAATKGIVYFPPGQYDIYSGDGTGKDSVLPVPPDKGLTFLGYGATIRMKNGGCAGANNGQDGKCGHRMFSTMGGKNSGYNGVADTPPLTFMGLTLDGNRAGQAGPWTTWESEQSHLMIFQAWSQQQNKGRIKVYVQDVNTRNSPGDGMSIDTKVDFTSWHTTHTDDFRGGLVATGGGSKIRVRDISTYSSDINYRTGFDVEIDQIGSIVNGIYDFTLDLQVDGAVVDGDLDIGSYITPEGGWFTFCWTTPLQCGTGSQQTYNNIQMTAGPVTIQSTGKNDVLNITNSTLRTGRFVTDVARLVYGTGIVNIVDTNFLVDNSFSRGQAPPSAMTGWHVDWALDGGAAKPPWPATLNFLRSNIQISNTFGAPVNPCFLRQYTKTSYDTLNITNSTIGSGWSSECPSGYTGTANKTGTGTPNAMAPNPDVPANQLACDGSPPVTTTTVAGTTTTQVPTTTAAPFTNRVEVESCTLGANVINYGTSIYGNGSVGSGTTATCTLTNSGSAGVYAMTTVYDTPGPFTRTVNVNGTDYPAAPGLVYSATSGWAPISNNVTLTTGSNTIVLEVSYITVDYFEFTSGTLATTTTVAPTTTVAATTTTTPLAQDCVRQEAESGTLVNWASAAGLPGWNGFGYVGDSNFTGSVTSTFTIPTSGTYRMQMRVVTGGSGAVRAVTIAGVSAGDIYVPTAVDWTIQPNVQAVLIAGSNTVKVEEIAANNGIGGALYIDYVELCLVAPSVPTTTTLPVTTTDPGASTTSSTSTTSTSTTTTIAVTTTVTSSGCITSPYASVVTASSGTSAWLTDGNESSLWVASSTTPQTIQLDLLTPRTIHTFMMKGASNSSPGLLLIDLLSPSGQRIGLRQTVTFRSGGTNRCFSVNLPTTANVRRVRISLQQMESPAIGLTPKLFEVGVK